DDADQIGAGRALVFCARRGEEERVPCDGGDHRVRHCFCLDAGKRRSEVGGEDMASGTYCRDRVSAGIDEHRCNTAAIFFTHQAITQLETRPFKSLSGALHVQLILHHAARGNLTAGGALDVADHDDSTSDLLAAGRGGGDGAVSSCSATNSIRSITWSYHLG